MDTFPECHTNSFERKIVLHGNKTWTLSQSATQISGSLERKILQRTFGPVQVKGTWRIQYSEELYRLHKDTDLVTLQACYKIEVSWACSKDV
jgi:hypothetical protein